MRPRNGTKPVKAKWVYANKIMLRISSKEEGRTLYEWIHTKI